MMNDLRRLIILAFQRGERQVEIFRRLKSNGISRQLISKTIKRWREMGSIADRPRSGRPRTARLVHHSWCKEYDIEFEEIRDASRECWLYHWTRRAQPFNEYWRMISD